MMRRAYRRPITAHDLDAPLAFYREEKKKEGFEAGIEMALRAILVSPHFLFKIEQKPSGLGANKPYPLSGLELASRLSFFLWGAPPDDRLRELAREGRLTDPQVLEEQARRMLLDPRSEALGLRFAAQWLRLDDLEKVNPDRLMFPDFHEQLRDAMRRETEIFFNHLVEEDRRSPPR